MFQSSSTSGRIVMNILLIALCVYAALARPEDGKVEKNSFAEALANAPKRGNPITGDSQDMSIPNVSEDVLDKALGDRRFVQRQLKCATGEGPCDPIGRKIKAHAPLVMRGMCVKCSQTEIKQIQRVMSHIQKNYPKEYAKMLKQYQSGN